MAGIMTRLYKIFISCERWIPHKPPSPVEGSSDGVVIRDESADKEVAESNEEEETMHDEQDKAALVPGK